MGIVPQYPRAEAEQVSARSMIFRGGDRYIYIYNIPSGKLNIYIMVTRGYTVNLPEGTKKNIIHIYYIIATYIIYTYPLVN